MRLGAIHGTKVIKKNESSKSYYTIHHHTVLKRPKIVLVELKKIER